METDPRTGITARWSDGKQLYRWLERGRRYQELPLEDGSLPVFVFELFSSDARNLSREDQRARYFRSFAVNPALSTAEHTVFERLDRNGRSGERFWVRNAGRGIVRHESLREGGVVRRVEISWFEANRPLSDEELWVETPLLARYSLMNNPTVFMVGLVVAAGAIGAAFWTLLLGLGLQISAKRARLWRVQAWALGGVALLLGALALLTSGGGGGHPPAIVFVWVLGIWAAVGFAMAGVFTAASYPVEFVMRRLLPRARGNPPKD